MNLLFKMEIDYTTCPLCFNQFEYGFKNKR